MKADSTLIPRGQGASQVTGLHRLPVLASGAWALGATDALGLSAQPPAHKVTARRLQGAWRPLVVRHLRCTMCGNCD